MIRLYVTLEALFPDGSMTGKALTANKELVKHVISNGHMSGGEVLWAFEIYLSEHSGLGKAYALIIKALYDEDALFLKNEN